MDLETDGLEEIVTLVINEDEGREINHTNLPDSLHSKFRIFDAFDALDVVLGKNGSRSSDRAEVEASVFLA